MNTVVQRLSKTWIVSLAHYIRLGAAIITIGCGITLTLDTPHTTFNVWADLLIIAMAMAIGAAIGTALIITVKIHDDNPDLCHACNVTAPRHPN